MAKLSLSAEHKNPRGLVLQDVLEPLWAAGFSNIYLELDLEAEDQDLPGVPSQPESAPEAPL